MSRYKNEIRRFIALELRVKRQVIPFVFDFGTVDDRFFGIERKRERTDELSRNIIYLLLLIIVGGGHGGRHPRRRDRYRFSSSSTCLMYGRGNASGRCYPASRSRPLCPYVHVVPANNPKRPALSDLLPYG